MDRAIKISPSLICMNFLEAKQQIYALNRLASSYHFDIADNHFTPTFGLPIEFLLTIKEAAAMPIEVHLMAENVEGTVEKLISTKVDLITLHVECIVSNAFRVIKRIKDAGIKVGVAINPITPVGSLNHILGIVDKISILTFDPGVAGQKVVNETLSKISSLAELKERGEYLFDIEADGSCNERNYKSMRTAGANQFVVGTSGLFTLDENIEKAWIKMMEYIGDEDIYRK